MLTRDDRYHEPVLLDEVIQHLSVRSGGAYVDCTAGTGGHMEAIAKIAGPTGLVIGCDLDGAALTIARERFEKIESSVPIAHWQLVHLSYTDIDRLGGLLPNGVADGILLDLGCSSLQLNDAARGFSFSADAPLDMRFDPDGAMPSAAEILRTYDERTLADIFFHLGEERRSRAIASAIVRRRSSSPITTTTQLRELVENITGRRAGRVSGATRVFQALRIYVNNELNNIETVLPKAFSLLGKGGTLVTISFHSLEDRIVKKYFKQLALLENVEILTRKPLKARDEELRRNPRSRSAMLRAIKKG